MQSVSAPWNTAPCGELGGSWLFGRPITFNDRVRLDCGCAMEHATAVEGIKAEKPAGCRIVLTWSERGKIPLIVRRWWPDVQTVSVSRLGI